ncbi:hypothetical protein [Bradyrhizobium sp. SZCCHNRI1009]|uniref:hypothetical protein n=1 Tax=Bradyrhizobium sp. SZCCHNRI1009 TaxID=3057277 RepID=UPI002916EA56|nr:hypothetical protein [Bradyrhizobium sp. SZCCHNRI1009]
MFGNVLFLLAVVPGLVAAYALLLRPILHRIPAFQTFYAEADGFWAKVWAICGKSITVLWGYVLGGIGSSLALLDRIAPAVGDADLKDKVSQALQSNPQILGYILAGISVITIAARVRSLLRA